MSSATAAREAAEAHLASLQAEYSALQHELGSLHQDSVDIARDLATAKDDLRRSAVAAYVSGSPLGDLSAMLTSDSPSDAIDRLNYSSQTASVSSEEVERYEQLKKLNDPDVVELSQRIELLDRELEEAAEAIIQTSAFEADAERALSAEQRRLEDERAEAAAAERAAATVAASATVVSETNADAGSTTSSSSSSSSTSSTSSTSSPSTVAPAPVSTTPPAPLPPAPAGGPSDAQWAQLRNCESGGNYQIVSASGRYRGAYQFSVATWASVGGSGDPAAASPAEQDIRAKILYERAGWGSWPHCGRYLR